MCFEMFSDLVILDSTTKCNSNYHEAIGHIPTAKKIKAVHFRKLIQERQNRISDIQKAINACFRINHQYLKSLAINELKEEANADKEYSIFVKALLIANGL